MKLCAYEDDGKNKKILKDEKVFLFFLKNFFLFLWIWKLEEKDIVI